MMLVNFFNVFLLFVFVILQRSASMRIDSVLSEQADTLHDAYLDSNVALKRRQTAGLIPFPRVGRNSADKYWSNQLFGQTKRREGLIPFPRVGKRSEEKFYDFPTAWFGPRVGRDSYRRPSFDLEDQYILSLLQDYPRLAESKKDDNNKPSFGPEDYVKRKTNSIGYPTFK